MKIILNGACGKMGRVLQTMIAEGRQGSSLAAAADAFSKDDTILSSLSLYEGEADCIIDFSNHAATEELCAYAAKRNLPLVIATTGQTDEERAVIAKTAEQIPVFFSGNMSLGIAVLTKLVQTAVRMFPDADVEIVESHHNQKVDVPSGTALMLARAVQNARPDAVPLVGRHENGKRARQEIGIHSLRMGNTVGVHEVIINTGAQLLTLKHEAQDRCLFAEGALSAAAFLIGKQPGLYNMDDLVAQG